MNEEKFLKWFNSHIESLETELLAKTRTEDLTTLRYMSGQLHEALTVRTMYAQLRKEEENGR